MKIKFRMIFAVFLILCAVFSAYAQGSAEDTGGRLILPEGLTEIEEEAFFGLTSIEEVVLPENIVKIGNKAFANSSIKRIYLPGSLQEIAENAFEGTEGLTGYGDDDTYASQYFDRIPYLAFEHEDHPVVYRALLIGENAYTSWLNGPDNDVQCMSAVLNGLANNFRVILQQDATFDEIIALIDIAFDGASEDDVSLFYYSGHGVTGAGEAYSGALQTVDYQYITTSELARWLSAVPGKVVVILDSCGSGAAISDGGDPPVGLQSNGINARSQTAETEENRFDAEAFNTSVIDAFSSFDSFVGASSSGSGASGMLLRSAELRQTKFYVITGSAYEENSVTTQIDGVWGGMLTRGIASGAGCSYPAGHYSGSMPADGNADNRISFYELASYCKTYVGNQQNVMSYSASDIDALLMR